MKPLNAKFVCGIGLASLVVFLGCAHQQPHVVPSPAPSTAPEATVQQEVKPDETSAQNQAQPSPQGTPPPSPERMEPDAAPEEKPTPAVAAKPRPPAPRKTANGKTPEVARNGSAKMVVKTETGEPVSNQPISPSPSPNDGPHDPAATEQLLQTTESSLSGLRRQLSPEEQAIVTQIKDFIGQSRQAIKENDLVRARNLAQKAHLLCDDLVRPR